MSLKVTLHELTGAGTKQKAMAERATAMMRDVVNRPAFREAVASRKFDSASFVGGGQQPDVLRLILSGAEFETESDAEIDLRVRFRSFGIFKRKTVGQTVEGQAPIETAYWFVNQCIAADDEAPLAAHWLHEWMHNVGYRHDTTGGDGDDVAYAVGELLYALVRSERPGEQ